MNLSWLRSSWALFTISFLARVPYIFAGYGREEDAWAQALNARLIAQSGQYEVSRLPGHPVYELLLAWLWPINHEYWMFNGLSAVASALSVVVFYRILKHVQLNRAFELSLIFSFIPVFFIAGTYTIDYNFALLLILLAWRQLQRGSLWLAGISLGVATGIRISSIGFLLPLTMLTWKGNPVRFLPFWILATATAAFSFLPPYLTYGLDFLDFHKPPFPGWASVIYKISIGVWGLPLLLVIAVIKSGWFFRGKLRMNGPESRVNIRVSVAIVIAWLLCLVVFARLPFKAEFFIPSIPFLLMLLGIYSSTREIRIILITAILSCFLIGFDYYNPYRGAPPSPLAIRFSAGHSELYLDPIQGPALIDHNKRRVKSRLVENVNLWADQQQDSTLLIAGWYWPELEMTRSGNTRVIFDYYTTQEEFLEYHTRGYAVYYLPEINEANHLINAHYLADSLGQVLDPL